LRATYTSECSTGPRISPEHLPRVFDPGFTTKGVGVRTGVGLLIAYRVSEDHGGRIEFSSTPPDKPQA